MLAHMKHILNSSFAMVFSFFRQQNYCPPRPSATQIDQSPDFLDYCPILTIASFSCFHYYCPILTIAPFSCFHYYCPILTIAPFSCFHDYCPILTIALFSCFHDYCPILTIALFSCCPILTIALFSCFHDYHLIFITIPFSPPCFRDLVFATLFLPPASPYNFRHNFYFPILTLVYFEHSPLSLAADPF